MELDPQYANHPCVRAGIHHYMAFKAKARDLSKRTGIPHMDCMEHLARILGFSDLHRAQGFFKKYRPDQMVKRPKAHRRTPEEHEVINKGIEIERLLSERNADA